MKINSSQWIQCSRQANQDCLKSFSYIELCGMTLLVEMIDLKCST